jgi:GT2 family glycosyltransferase
VTQPALLSVIIPHWNAIRHLPICLDALRAQTYPRLEIIIADNASTDGSQALVARDYPEVKIVQLVKNAGFTGACNAGIRAARGEFIALLNNDTEVHLAWAAEVVAAFARHPSAGSVASKMLLFDQRDHFHTAGDFFGMDGWPGNRGAWERDLGQYDEEEYVFSACGGSSVYRRAMLDQTGLLDDTFFFSMEDIDLAWRAQMMGWKCVYAPRAVVFHHLAASGGGVTASFYDGRNALYVLFKNLPHDLWRQYWRRIAARQVTNAWAALRAWRGKAARARLRGMAMAFFHLPRLMRQRANVQARRTMSIEYLNSILVEPPR